MKKTFKGVFLILVPMILIFGCVPTLENYKPKNPNENEIKAVLMAYENAFNRHDIQGVLSTIHESAEIMTGTERLRVSKSDYAEILPKRFKALGSLKLRKPKIELKGDRSVVMLELNTPVGSLPNANYTMIRS